MATVAVRQSLLPGFGLIFRATRTTRRGMVLKAKDYGYRGWPMVVWVGFDPAPAG